MKLKQLPLGMALSLSIIGGGVQAQNIITDPGFEAGTGTFNNGAVSASNPGIWSAFPTYESVAGASAQSSVSVGTCRQDITAPAGTPIPFPAGWSDNNFAQHFGSKTGACDQVDKLMQSVLIANVPTDTDLELKVKYILKEPQGSRTALWYVCGLTGAQNVERFFGGANCASSNAGAATIASGTIGDADAWTEFTSPTFQVPASTYDAIAVVLQTGGRIFPDPGLIAGFDDVYLGPTNSPPDCSAAYPSVDTLWPPNHKFVDVNVLGVTDPDSDPTTINIDSIFQDEPVNDLGDGNTSPDGAGVGTDTASIRSERAGGGNGRVYTIAYTATDDKGASCSGEAKVSVPKSKGKNGAAVDDGATFDSTIP
jgi:hypothetical protein